MLQTLNSNKFIIPRDVLAQLDCARSAWDNFEIRGLRSRKKINNINVSAEEIFSIKNANDFWQVGSRLQDQMGAYGALPWTLAGGRV